MNKLYLFLLLCVIVCGAYLYGANVADAKCRLRINQENFTAIQKYQKQILNTKRITHDTVYKMGVSDIRHILRDKYTIGE